MVQAWYQGGISVFDWTDASNPVEIAYHDRGPSDADAMGMAGSWSVYWYNGVMVSSEIGRGLDIFELIPSEVMSQNEIDAAKSVRLDHLNSQGQPRFEWPFTFALAGAYVDQLERSRSMPQARVTEVRAALSAAVGASGSARRSALTRLPESWTTKREGPRTPQRCGRWPVRFEGSPGVERTLRCTKRYKGRLVADTRTAAGGRKRPAAVLVHYGSRANKGSPHTIESAAHLCDTTLATLYSRLTRLERGG